MRPIGHIKDLGLSLKRNQRPSFKWKEVCCGQDHSEEFRVVWVRQGKSFSSYGWGLVKTRAQIGQMSGGDTGGTQCRFGYEGRRSRCQRGLPRCCKHLQNTAYLLATAPGADGTAEQKLGWA